MPEKKSEGQIVPNSALHLVPFMFPALAVSHVATMSPKEAIGYFNMVQQLQARSFGTAVGTIDAAVQTAAEGVELAKQGFDYFAGIMNPFAYYNK